jgi:hypothetical protein
VEATSKGWGDTVDLKITRCCSGRRERLDEVERAKGL